MLKVHPFKNSAVSLVLLLLALIIGTLLLLYLGPLDLYFLDLQFVLSRAFSSADTISDRLVIILIDKQSMAEPQIYPSSENRQYHSQLLEKLRQAGAAVIAFDIVFTTRDNKIDKEFASVIRKCGNVIGGEVAEYKTINILRESFIATGSLYTEDYGKAPRRIIVHPDHTALKAFSLVIAETFYDSQGIRKEHSKPIWPQNHFWINYAYKPAHFPLFNYKEILTADTERIADEKRTPLSILKDKIVLIGYDQEQWGLPPLTGQKLPGIYAHAYAVECLLDSSQITPISLPINFLLLLLSLIAVMFLHASEIRWLRLTGPWIWLAFLFGLQSGMLYLSHVWINFTAPFVGSLSLKVLMTSLDRLRNTRALKRLKNEVAELLRLKEKIEQTEELKDTLIHSIFHDIKNHVGSIETTIEMLTERSNNDPNLLRKTGIIRLACQNIASLSRNLLEVKQLEEGKLKLNRELLGRDQLESLAHKFCSTPAAEIKNIHVTIEPCATDSFAIYADCYFLERILHNLFDNAFKYSFSNGEVKFACEVKEEKNLLALYNTGTPLSVEQQELIFQKYYRIQQENSNAERKSYSKGLGLYFCRLVMQAHGGEIRAESDRDGNYFYLDFNAKNP